MSDYLTASLFDKFFSSHLNFILETFFKKKASFSKDAVIDCCTMQLYINLLSLVRDDFEKLMPLT